MTIFFVKCGVSIQYYFQSFNEATHLRKKAIQFYDIFIFICITVVKMNTENLTYFKIKCITHCTSTLIIHKKNAYSCLFL